MGRMNLISIPIFRLRLRNRLRVAGGINMKQYIIIIHFSFNNS